MRVTWLAEELQHFGNKGMYHTLLDLILALPFCSPKI